MLTSQVPGLLHMYMSLIFTAVSQPSQKEDISNLFLVEETEVQRILLIEAIFPRVSMQNLQFRIKLWPVECLSSGLLKASLCSLPAGCYTGHNVTH